jgi:hypothetical protein
VSADLYAAWLTAGNNLQPAVGWLAANWINLAIAVSIGSLGFSIIRWSLRDTRRPPAAPDNVPPIDDDLLIACRRIHRLEVRDPETPRLVNDYLRQKQRKEDTP